MVACFVNIDRALQLFIFQITHGKACPVKCRAAKTVFDNAFNSKF